MFKLPPAVWRLTAAYALVMTAAPMLVLIGGIIGTDIAPHTGLATLPLSLAVAGVAASTLPLGRLQARFGRRPVFVAYAALGIGVALFAGFTVYISHFVGFCLAAFGIGWCAASAHQYRFAALEQAPPEKAAAATSTLLLGGILAAFLGPEIAVRGRDLLGTPFAGSFLVLAGCSLLGLILVASVPDSRDEFEAHQAGGQPLLTILRSPPVFLAISAGAVAYGIMSFVMTATPISMHEHLGHSLEATKTVIQSHIIAMYLPSLIFSFLFARLGFAGMMWAGTAALAGTIVIALTGDSYGHLWIALILLGVGWNFLYLSGTNLLPHGHHRADRYRVQSTNDFLVFSIQTVVTLGSGWVLFNWQWQGILLISLPLILTFSVLLLRTSALKTLQIR